MTVLEDFVHTCVARLGFKDKTLPPALERPARQIAHKWGETEGQLRCPELEKECNSVIDTLGCSIWSRGQSRSTDLVEDIDSRSLYQEHLYFEDQDHRRQLQEIFFHLLVMKAENRRKNLKTKQRYHLMKDPSATRESSEPMSSYAASSSSISDAECGDDKCTVQAKVELPVSLDSSGKPMYACPICPMYHQRWKSRVMAHLDQGMQNSDHWTCPACLESTCTYSALHSHIQYHARAGHGRHTIYGCYSRSEIRKYYRQPKDVARARGLGPVEPSPLRTAMGDTDLERDKSPHVPPSIPDQALDTAPVARNVAMNPSETQSQRSTLSASRPQARSANSMQNYVRNDSVNEPGRDSVKISMTGPQPVDRMGNAQKRLPDSPDEIAYINRSKSRRLGPAQHVEIEERIKNAPTGPAAENARAMKSQPIAYAHQPYHCLTQQLQPLHTAKAPLAKIYGKRQADETGSLDVHRPSVEALQLSVERALTSPYTAYLAHKYLQGRLSAQMSEDSQGPPTSGSVDLSSMSLNSAKKNWCIPGHGFGPRRYRSSDVDPSVLQKTRFTTVAADAKEEKESGAQSHHVEMHMSSEKANQPNKMSGLSVRDREIGSANKLVTSCGGEAETGPSKWPSASSDSGLDTRPRSARTEDKSLDFRASVPSAQSTGTISDTNLDEGHGGSHEAVLKDDDMTVQNDLTLPTAPIAVEKALAKFQDKKVVRGMIQRGEKHPPERLKMFQDIFIKHERALSNLQVFQSLLMQEEASRGQ